FPLLAIFYLVYRRYWTAAISLVIALVILLFLLPIPFRGWHQSLNDARDWQRGMLRYEQGGIAQRPARGYTWKNQSIFGLANRLLRRVSVDEEPDPPAYANLADLDFRTVNIVIMGSALLLGLSFVVAMPRQRAPEGDAREFAALLSLILIFTPPNRSEPGQGKAHRLSERHFGHSPCAIPEHDRHFAHPQRFSSAHNRFEDDLEPSGLISESQ